MAIKAVLDTNVLVSDDQDLPVPDNYENIRVVTPQQFVEILADQTQGASA